MGWGTKRDSLKLGPNLGHLTTLKQDNRPIALQLVLPLMTLHNFKSLHTV